MDKERLHASLRLHEGISLKPYTDTTGHLTIGIGHNLDNGITIQQAYQLLDSDIEICLKEMDRYHPVWMHLPTPQQNVLIEMMFNLGAPRLGGFVKMWAAIERRDFKAAAAEMINSKWARQVGNRAKTLAAQMENGFCT